MRLNFRFVAQLMRSYSANTKPRPIAIWYHPPTRSPAQCPGNYVALTFSPPMGTLLNASFASLPRNSIESSPAQRRCSKSSCTNRKGVGSSVKQQTLEQKDLQTYISP